MILLCLPRLSPESTQPTREIIMPLLASDALQRIRGGKLALGLGVHHLRGAAVPLLARAAGYDFLFIDAEHGAISTPEISQISVAALGLGVVPIVRICAGAFDEGTRALDNGALGLVVPHVDTPEEAHRLVQAFRFAPMGHRSTGGSNAAFGYRPPPAAEASKILNAELLIIPMIETPLAVENAEAIAAIAGIDALLIGTNDLALEMGISRAARPRAGAGGLREGRRRLPPPQQGAGHGRRLRPGAGDPVHRRGRALRAWRQRPRPAAERGDAARRVPARDTAGHELKSAEVVNAKQTNAPLRCPQAGRFNSGIHARPKFGWAGVRGRSLVIGLDFSVSTRRCR
jgi:2-keto-3-deoxy-L-rhamnonate aldolase RhmA